MRHFTDDGPRPKGDIGRFYTAHVANWPVRGGWTADPGPQSEISQSEMLDRVPSEQVATRSSRCVANTLGSLHDDGMRSQTVAGERVWATSSGCSCAWMGVCWSFTT